MEPTGGYFKIWRELLDKPIWQCSTPEQKAILITLLAMANWKENDWEWQGKRFKAKPGQFVTSLPKIAEKAGNGVSIQNVRTALSRFQDYGFLTDKTTNRGRLITIVNWALYQADKEQTTAKPTGNQQATNRQLTSIEELKNSKRGRSKTIYREIQHLSLSVDDFEKLAAEYGEPAVNDILDEMANYAELKKYNSAYVTAKTWLKRRREKATGKPATPEQEERAERLAEYNQYFENLRRRQEEMLNADK